MIIKSSKAYWGITGVMLCFAPIFFIAFFMELGPDYLPFSIVLILYWLFFTAQTCITYCRTLIIDKEGCTVKFLRYKKTYEWSELETKSIVDCRYSWGERIPYKSCFIFSKKKRKNPRRLQPALYGLYFHPFSFMFVYFDPHLEVKTPCPDIYLIEEEKFMQKMSEWNVEIIDERAKNTGQSGDSSLIDY